MSKKTTVPKILEFIKDINGKIFSIEFIKRTTGEKREMVCRTGVKSHLKGGDQAYDPEVHKLIFVFDMQKKGYRSIPIEGILRIKMEGEWYEVEGVS